MQSTQADELRQGASAVHDEPQSTEVAVWPRSSYGCSGKLPRDLASLPYPGYIECEEELARRRLGEMQPQVVPVEIIMGKYSPGQTDAAFAI
jgi:hypothetical protein